MPTQTEAATPTAGARPAPPTPPLVSYAKFGAFVSVPGPDRLGLARSIKVMQAESYQPARDHYRAIRRAIVDGSCANSPEALETRLALAIDNAYPRRRDTYRRVALAWREHHRALGLDTATVAKIRSRTWSEAPQVRVNPAFAATAPDGRHRLVTIHYPLEPLPEGTATVMLRLAQLAYADLGAGAPVIVDIQHDTVWTPPETYPDGFDDWLVAESAGLRSLLERLPLGA